MWSQKLTCEHAEGSHFVLDNENGEAASCTPSTVAKSCYISTGLMGRLTFFDKFLESDLKGGDMHLSNYFFLPNLVPWIE